MSPMIPETLTVHVPFRIRKRGGRKVMVMPDGASAARQTVDNTLIKALARAFRWKRMLESGEFTTIAELADHEKIASTYLTRILRLTLLAPESVEGIVGGRQGVQVTLAGLTERIPAAWEGQRTCAGQFAKVSPFPRLNHLPDLEP